MGDRLNQVEVLGGMAKCMTALKDFEQVITFLIAITEDERIFTKY
jgi:hypothetical protein